MAKKKKIPAKESKLLNFTNVHLEEDYETLFGIRQAVQENLYNEAINQLNMIFDVVRERYNFMQYGLKTKETYYTHAVKGIHHILQLQGLIFEHSPQDNEESLEKLKLFCLSYLIHDLNKFEWNKGKSLSELWSVKTVLFELESIDSISSKKIISIFFSKWKEFINDIYLLVVSHSRIHRYSGRIAFSDVKDIFGIDITPLNTKLSKQDLSTAINLMQLVDILDLIKELSFQQVKVECVDKNEKEYVENIHQGEILKHCQERLSQITKESIVFEKISVTMNASKFSNVILNCAIEILGEEFKIYPLLTFTNGILVFAKRVDMEHALKNEIMDKIQQKIADRLVEIIDDLMMKKINEKNFLYSITGQGVKLGKYIYQQPHEKKKMRDLLKHLSEKLEPFAYKSGAKSGAGASRYTSVFNSNQYIKDNIKSHALIQKWKGGKNWDLLEDDLRWRMARYCHTIYITVLKLYQRNSQHVDQAKLMQEFLDGLEIFPELSEIYDQSTDLPTWYRFSFFHIVGDVLALKLKTMEDITPILIDLVLKKMDVLSIEDKTIPNPLEFVKEHIHMFRTPTSSFNLIQHTNPNNKILCSSCGKRMESLGSIKKNQTHYKLYSEHVSDGIAVQKFTNFKIAGEKKEPVRMICESCKWRFYLNKILSLVAGKFAKIFATFYLPDGYPFAIVRGIQLSLEKFKNDPNYEDSVSAFMIDFKKFKEKDNRNDIYARPQKAYGFALPSILEEICGSIPFSWKIDQKLTVNEQYWNLTKQVIALSVQTGLKVVASKLKNEYEELLGKDDVLIQDIPSDYKWLFGNTIRLSLENARAILNIMLKIEDVIKSILTKDIEKNCVAMVKNLQLGHLETIYYLDSLIRSPSSRASKAKNSGYKIMMLRTDILSKLKEIYELKSKI